VKSHFISFESINLVIIFEKNQNMKTEKVLSIIFLISLVFKVAGWPGGGALMVLSLTILTLCYFPFGFYFLNDKPVFKQKLSTSIIYGWLLPVAILGVEFKLMYWPGYGPMLIIGIMTSAILLVVAYMMHKKATTEENKLYHKNLLLRTLILFFCAFVCFLIPEKTIIDISFQYDEKLKELYLKKSENTNDLELQKEIELYHRQQSEKQNP
jgi:hypothetical protein